MSSHIRESATTTVGHSSALTESTASPSFFQPVNAGSGFFSPAAPVVQRTPAALVETDPEWADFTEAFNREFQSILHVFNPEGYEPSRETVPGSPSGDALDTARLQALFSETQRDLLMDYFRTHEIPDHLFNGDEPLLATAQQRIMMSAIILSNGTYRPGSFEQTVHARMCFHWVRIVHNYAAAAPGSLSGGVMGTFDHDGNIVLPSGRTESVFMGSMVLRESLPEEEAESIGPIHAGTGHEEAAAAEMAREEEDPTARRRVHRRYALPFDRFGEIEPGDWLYYYNANRDAGGAHSVIFSRWASGEEEINGVRYRRAIVFSQNNPADGGHEHGANLGEQYNREGGVVVFPILRVARVSESAHPAATVAELLPATRGSRDEAPPHIANPRYITTASRRLGRPVSRERIMEHLRSENATSIDAIDYRLTDGQRALLEEANATTDLETLIRLTQRLRQIRANMAIYERNMTATYEGRLDASHAAAETGYEESSARITGEIAEIDRQLAEISSEAARLEAIRSAMSHTIEIRALQRTLRQLRGRMSEMDGHDPGRAAIRTHILEIRDALRALQDDAHSSRGEISELREDIRTTNAPTRRLRRARERLEAELEELSASLPFGLVHPGNLREEVSDRPTGRLRSLFPTPRDLAPFTE